MPERLKEFRGYLGQWAYIDKLWSHRFEVFVYVEGGKLVLYTCATLEKARRWCRDRNYKPVICEGAE